MTTGLFSYAALLAAQLVLAALLALSWRGRLMGLFAVFAVLATAAWAVTGIALSLGLSLPMRLPAIAELVRNGAWLAFLTNVLIADANRARPWRLALFAVVGLGALLTVALPWLLERAAAPSPSWLRTTVSVGWVLQAVLGLLLVEQVYRNRAPKQRWEIKHLCVGLGAVFAYDLFFYSDALLMQRVDPSLWEARGVVNALIVPLIAVSAARNPRWSLDVHVSRQVVFHTATLTGAGLYLMAMAAAGYYVRFAGGAWGTLLQIAFLFAAGLFLLVLLFSGQLRARLRVLLNEHFFSFHYDYREEWLRFTDALSRSGMEPPEAVVTALAGIVSSPGGMLWVKNEGGAFELVERTNFPEPSSAFQSADGPFISFLQRSGWIVDLREYRSEPDLYQELEVPGWLVALPVAWLVIPLFFREDLCGFVVLGRSHVRQSLNWEDRSLLKTAGRQAAGHVAQYLADHALMRARQFEAFHQLSAYVAHDLKNLLAQQSLILANAEKHKGNPEFLDDVIRTVQSSVERMNRLMAQLRNGVREDRLTSLSVEQVVREAVSLHSVREPTPCVQKFANDLKTVADRERLRTVFGHIIQNAQEATGPGGAVIVRALKEGRFAVVEVQDDGVGMSQDFVRDRLFRPFDSTKGLTGMGVGVFESREFVRSLGGDVVVDSTPGKGSTFRIYLPSAGNSESIKGPGGTKDEVCLEGA